MAFTVTRIWTRPSTSSEWFTKKMTQDIDDHIQKTFVDTGLRLKQSTSVNADRTQLTVETVWKDEAAWNLFKADAIVAGWLQLRDSYNKEAGVTSERTVQR